MSVYELLAFKNAAAPYPTHDFGLLKRSHRGVELAPMMVMASQPEECTPVACCSAPLVPYGGIHLVPCGGAPFVASQPEVCGKVASGPEGGCRREACKQVVF